MQHTSAKTVRFVFNNQGYMALPGQSIAAALFANGVKTLRFSPHQHQPRGMFCLMGSCQECLVMVGGKRVLACKTEASADLNVHSVLENDPYESF
ncbi:(2Fe-2S)-binding protein [Pantoea vagans]|uniref:(2Fe-2S)-binding protein n=1 Tax=Pantoea vagans TaxID=470934 RepID=UPI0023AFC9F2|nr:(2Fe-2S)-binding protein [Pantoea vagans]MDE8559241.1 (2Fe-2S)-binding protein [Pantoea vagans]MDE8579241.1 (2Fe-2S)-binding protein [Pantoea vagans]